MGPSFPPPLTGRAAVKATTCPLDVPGAAAAQVCDVRDAFAGHGSPDGLAVAVTRAAGDGSITPGTRLCLPRGAAPCPAWGLTHRAARAGWPGPRSDVRHLPLSSSATTRAPAGRALGLRAGEGPSFPRLLADPGLLLATGLAHSGGQARWQNSRGDVGTQPHSSGPAPASRAHD